MTLPTLLALLTVFVAAPLSWYVAAKLWRLSRASREIRALRSAAISALALALIVTIFAGIFVNNEMPVPPLDREATMVLSRGALLVLSIVASAYWLRRYR